MVFSKDNAIILIELYIKRKYNWHITLYKFHVHKKKNKNKKEEKESKGPSYSVTLLIKHPAATEPFLHLTTEESGLTSAFAQLGGRGVTYRVL